MSTAVRPVKKIIHVNQHVIRRNRVTGESAPVITVKTHKQNVYGSDVEIAGASRIRYRPEKPLSCGATVWIETTSEVIVDSKTRL